ncbi:DNA alkylation repair protein [Actinopolymorpha pittospori]|uniref:3-methyladenine DNA glycosylase AlkD n=1 Tax=Actinopolymorpha pittospori TaxID=648752 RepID=A0A927N1B8_9ACTN|nr:3-methyladenine DNA glycosylase AlkD [Actinopolymorpha pittospori]
MSEGKPNHELLVAVRVGLATVADPARAEPMRAYMKSAMPFRGVPSPELKSVCRHLLPAHPIARRGDWEATVLALWDDAAYREERYAALALTGHRLYRAWQDVAALSLYDHLTVTGAWWDFVDEIAANRVGPILAADPGGVGPLLLRWASDDDIWRRRVAILAQLKAKSRTDTELLRLCVEPSLGRPEFFLRKGIGWALREYAKTDPDWVRTYVATHFDRLAPLSRREAVKNLRGEADGPAGAGEASH